MSEGGKLYFQGRVVASTYEAAKNSVVEALRQKGYAPVGEVKPFPCLIQPWENVVWWEYMCEVEEV